MKNLKSLSVEFYSYPSGWNISNGLSLVKHLPENHALEKLKLTENQNSDSVVSVSDMLLAWDPTRVKLTKLFNYDGKDIVVDIDKDKNYIGTDSTKQQQVEDRLAHTTIVELKRDVEDNDHEGVNYPYVECEIEFVDDRTSH